MSQPALLQILQRSKLTLIKHRLQLNSRTDGRLISWSGRVPVTGGISRISFSRSSCSNSSSSSNSSSYSHKREGTASHTLTTL